MIISPNNCNNSFAKAFFNASATAQKWLWLALCAYGAMFATLITIKMCVFGSFAFASGSAWWIGTALVWSFSYCFFIGHGAVTIVFLAAICYLCEKYFPEAPAAKTC